MKKILPFIFILLLVTAVFLYFGHAKAGYFIDEVYTYGLANSHFAPYLIDVAGGDFDDRLITNEELVSYTTVDSGEALDFASVYYNQEADVHPPLYYWLFNTASSLAGNRFSKWTGLALDYVIFLGTLAMLGIICHELFHNKFTVMAALLLYGLSKAAVSTAVYIRMYGLLTFFTLVLVFFVLRLLRTGKGKYAVLSGLTICAGMMTQYYFVFYACFISIAAGLYLFVKKKNKTAFGFLACALLGVLLMILIFPASLKHIFVGNGQVVSGGMALANLLDVSSWPHRLSTYLHFVTSGLKASVIVGAIAFVFLLATRRLEFSGEIAVIVLPALVAWLFIALVAAVLEERYIYNIMPVFVIFVAWLLNHLHIYYAPLAVIAALCLQFTGCNIDYIQPQALESTAALSPYKACPVVYLTDNKFASMTADYYELLQFDDFFAATDAASPALVEYIGDADATVLFIDTNAEWSSGLDPAAEIAKLSAATGYDSSELILSNSLSQVYVLR